MIFGHILKEEFETTIKIWVKRMEAYLAANGQYFEKENHVFKILIFYVAGESLVDTSNLSS